MLDELAPTFLIGADIVPTKSNLVPFCEGNANALVGSELLAILKSVDYALFNLEVPLADKKSPIEKCGPNLIAPTEAVRGLKALNKGAFCLANNHIMDQGAEGLSTTLSVLDAAEIPHFGAGENLADAMEPFLVSVGGKRLGVYACAEHEFSIASECMPGANPFDPLESIDHVRSLRQLCDYLVVLYHGGKEHYRYPSPLLRKGCRKLAEAGANLVVCQHSHCIGCAEDWSNCTIVYGQGNFLFDDTENEFWQTSLLIKVVLSEDPIVSYLPLRKHGAQVILATGRDAEEIVGDFRKRSHEITVPGFVESKYADFSVQSLDGYLNTYAPGSHTLAGRIVGKLTRQKMSRMLTNRRQMLAELNYLDCEAHRELFVEGIREFLKHA